MKVFVILKFKPFGAEEYFGIAKTEKEVIKKIKEKFPYMRGTIKGGNLSSDKDGTYLFRVVEEVI